MFAVIWRHSGGSPWNIHKDPVPTEQDAREVINKLVRYDMLRREYRIAPLGDVETWHDPFAEQAAREGEAGNADDRV